MAWHHNYFAKKNEDSLVLRQSAADMRKRKKERGRDSCEKRWEQEDKEDY